MPQLDFVYWPGQIFWLLITFGVVYLALSRILLPRVHGTIDARTARIDGDLAEARRLRDQAEQGSQAAEAEMAAARAKAQKTAADAKARSAAEAQVRQGALEAELSAKLTEAETRIRASRDQAMGNVRAIAGETAAAIAEKLTGVPASSAEVDAALSGAEA